MDRKLKRLIFDTVIFIISMSMAWYLLKGGFLHDLVALVLPIRFLAPVLAGLLYASFLTAPISVAMIAVLAQDSNPLVLAILGGLGAACSDLLIVKFFRGRLSKDVDLVSRQMQFKRLNNFLIKWKLDALVPIIGAIIVASPLPDELGLMMLGASKLKYYQIALLTFVLNTAGILLIVVPISVLI